MAGGRHAWLQGSTRAVRIGAVVVVMTVVASLGGAWPSASAVASALRRYPYLSEVVGNAATVNWATDRSQTTGSRDVGRRERWSVHTHELGRREPRVDHGRFHQ